MDMSQIRSFGRTVVLLHGKDEDYILIIYHGKNLKVHNGVNKIIHSSDRSTALHKIKNVINVLFRNRLLFVYSFIKKSGKIPDLQIISKPKFSGSRWSPLQRAVLTVGLHIQSIIKLET